MSKRRTFEEFIKESIKKHGDKYDYSRVVWKDSHTKIEIICPKHGSFWQTPRGHYNNGYGCNKCAIEKRAEENTSTTETFIEKAKRKHNNFYSYEKTEYIKAHKPVIITCPKHGDFIQMAYSHLNGDGCSKCNNSRLENDVIGLLNELNIDFIQHYHKRELGKLELDFFIPSLNIAIECQGKQHFGYGGWGIDKEINDILKRDLRKNEICKSLNIKLLYYARKDYFKNVNDLYERISFDLEDLKKKLYG